MAKKMILVVDDDPDMQTIYKDLLGEKYSLLVAGDTKTAMELLNKNKVDLMILDIILPGETGDTFFVHLRQMPKFKGLKVLCVTVIGDLTSQFKRIDSSVMCLSKPFDRNVLLSSIEGQLKEKK